MLIVNRLGEDAGRYYVPGTVTGRWCGAGRGDLALDGTVSAHALDAVLKGRDPRTGAALSDRRVAHRRGGVDLIFTAPKSVSLLAALAPDGDVVAKAHLRACADAFGWLESHGCWARRSGGLVSTSGFIAARFSHGLSAAGEPHLHTHVLVANVTRSGDGGWSAVDGGSLWLHRRTVGAAYHLALRQQLLAGGLRPRFDVRTDGTADIADIPRSAIDAVSSRRHQIRDRLGPGGDPGPRTLTAAQRTTRELAPESTTWAERARTAGFGPAEARRVMDDARQRAAPGAADPGVAPADRLADDVVGWLEHRRSTFAVPDVMQALAATHGEGASAADAHQWSLAFIDASPRAPDGRRTSRRAAARDATLARVAIERAGTGIGLATGDGDGADLGPIGTWAPHPSTGVGRLVGSGNGVEVLTRPSVLGDDWPVSRSWGGFVDQAATIDAARTAWQDAGHAVAVDALSATAAARWRALTGLGWHLRGAPLPAVLVVDRADRRTTTELGEIFEQATSADSKVVLVVGGTLPARRVALSQGLEQLALRLGPAGPDVTAATAVRLDASGRGSAAMDRVIDTWHDRDRSSSAPRMVALGPAECDELNRRARDRRRADDRLTGPDEMIAGRPYAVGDEVVTTRRGSVAAGTAGRVLDVKTGGRIVVRTDQGQLDVDRRAGRFLRHAYAVTPGMLRFDARAVILLGHPEDLGRRAGRVVASCAVLADAGLVPDVRFAPQPPPPTTGRWRQPAQSPDTGLGL